jgi:hypothetical protein
MRLREQFKGLNRKNLQTGCLLSELCEQGNVFLQGAVKNNG